VSGFLIQSPQQVTSGRVPPSSGRQQPTYCVEKVERQQFSQEELRQGLCGPQQRLRHGIALADVLSLATMHRDITVAVAALPPPELRAGIPGRGVPSGAAGSSAALTLTELRPMAITWKQTYCASLSIHTGAILLIA
jgi:hypothetical protein